MSVITGAVVVLGQRTITDILPGILAVVTLLLVWKVKRLPEPVMVRLTVRIEVVLTLLR